MGRSRSSSCPLAPGVPRPVPGPGGVHALEGAESSTFWPWSCASCISGPCGHLFMSTSNPQKPKKVKHYSSNGPHSEIDTQRGLEIARFPSILGVSPGIFDRSCHSGETAARLQAPFVSISLCENRMAGTISSRSSRENGIEGEGSDPNFHFVLKLRGGLCLLWAGIALSGTYRCVV